jgi:hypothetical protein
LYVHIADLQTKKKLLLFNGHRREWVRRMWTHKI